MLRRLRMRSLAALRGSVEPVSPEAFARFLPDWQHLARPLEGIDGVAAVIEQLAGVPIPASAWEALILPSRVRDYSPGMLDELTATGEVLWSGHGSLPGRDGWIALHPADTAPLTLAPPEDEIAPDSLDARILEALAGGGAYFAAQLRQATGAENEQSVIEALWNLTWSGRVTNDTFAPVRTLIGGGSQAHRVARRAPRSRMYRGATLPRMTASTPPRPPAIGGRWSLLPTAEPDAALRATASASLLLDRYGVVTRGSVQAEGLPGGFAQAYRTLAGFEQAGHCRRGYLIEKLGAAQFAASATVDRLRQFAGLADPEPLQAMTLAATDPANPYGAPCRGHRSTASSTVRVARPAGSSCWSTARSCCTWSAAASRRSRSPITRRASPPPRRASPPRRGSAASTPSRSSRSTASSSTAPRSPARCAMPASSNPRAGSRSAARPPPKRSTSPGTRARA